MAMSEKQILEHLEVYGSGADTYIVTIGMNNKDIFMFTVAAQVEEWVEKNGGTFELVSHKKIYYKGKKGLEIKIRFPVHNHQTTRPMKSVMSLLYLKEKGVVDWYKKLK